MGSLVSSNLQAACMHQATDISGDTATAALKMATTNLSGDIVGPVFDSGDLRRRRPGAGADESPAADAAAVDEDFDSSTKSSLSTSSSDEEVPGGVVGSPAGEGDDGREGGGQVGGAAAVLRYAYRASTPAHRKVKESPLSSDAIFKQTYLANLVMPFYVFTAGNQDYDIVAPNGGYSKFFVLGLFIQKSHAGLFNLCIVVLVAVNSRLIIENLMKYGLLIGSGFWVSSKTLSDWPLFMCCLTLQVLFLAAFLVEKLAQHKLIPDLVVVLLHVVIATTAILYPAFVILRCDSAVLSGLTLMLVACIVWLKLVSYAHTNYDIRAVLKSNKKGSIHVSLSDLDQACNVGFKSLIYFMFAPTLCYQPTYPRTACIRKRWVTRQIIKLVIFTGFMGFIIEQYINPIVQNSEHPLKGNFLYAIERVLKLSVPTLYVWLCMFYCFFHLWLNILAELLQFGDREFYKDWWNAKTIEEYWRLWNMPVHKWMVRHIYFPCLRNGLPKGIAVVIAFFVSAVFHEVCIGIPCRNFKLWAFIGIMFQVPLVVLTNFLQNRFKNSMVGNMIFWLFFCILGQPMCVLLYYHDLMNQKAQNQLLL